MASSRDSLAIAPPAKRRKLKRGCEKDLLPDASERTEIKLESSDDREVTMDTIQDYEKKIERHKNLFMQVLNNSDAKAIPEVLLREIQTSVSFAIRVFSYVVFLGEQGSGKSTIINSLLGFPLLPTDSSGEACTAIPIEVHAAKEPGTFTGEANYISSEQWISEIVKAKNALCQGTDFDEDIVEKLMTKIQIVYPQLEVSGIEDKSVDEILAMNNTNTKLGTVQSIAHDDWDKFRDTLYELTVANSKPVKRGQTPPAQVWPLIEVVKVYVDSSALKSGLVLVDVPGILDSNRVRADRATDYLRNASAVCIVAPAQRASSSSTAYGLLRNTLEQIQYGGRLDRVILLSSKSDDIQPREIRKRFDDPNIHDVFNKKCEVENDLKVMSEELKDKEAKLQLSQSVLKDRDLDVKLYNRKLKDVIAGKPQYCSGIRVNGTLRPPKPKGKPLTKTAIKARLREYSEQYEKAKLGSEALKPEVETMRQAVAQAENDMAEYQKAYFDICLAVRNDNIITKQKDIYAKLIRNNHDMAAAAAGRAGAEQEVSEESMDQYCQDLKAKLPVFCVSAKAYLQLENIQQFEDACMIHSVEQTQIPALCNHLTTLAEHARDESLQNAFKRLETTLHSLYLHVMESVEPRVVDQNQVDCALVEARRHLESLSLGLNDLALTASTTVQQKLVDTLIAKHDAIVQDASIAAMERMKPYGEHPSDDNPSGLFAAEYKAAVFNEGVWTGSRMRFDWNRRIARSLMTSTGDFMARLYTGSNNYTNQVFSAARTACMEIFAEFYRVMEICAGNAGVNAYAWTVVKDQHARREALLADLFMHARQTVRDAPAEAIRDLVADVQKGMSLGYTKAQCVSQGLGARAAMSVEVLEQIRRGNNRLFSKVLQKIEKKLKEHVEKVVQQLKVEWEGFADEMRGDYESAFTQLDGVVLMSDDPVRNKLRAQLLASGLVSHGAAAAIGKPKKIKADAGDEVVAMDFIEQLDAGVGMA
ncbi:hypothetical protein H2198_003785 [Neophaeococcomyces mojaviensis]|uniref:Uncharacterized protein n=1 Tax=Neophaeococcomyces mojaviensis TaxID=3383035 RepID=A0ACC3AAP2_9EURO|nr:hypothetical protein H2198_003785 [Knufia sp. JES_112]